MCSECSKSSFLHVGKQQILVVKRSIEDREILVCYYEQRCMICSSILLSTFWHQKEFLLRTVELVPYDPVFIYIELIRAFSFLQFCIYPQSPYLVSIKSEFDPEREANYVPTMCL